MGRINPLAAVYIIRNIKNSKVYIGETSNYTDRMSHYGTVARGRADNNSKRPIDIAIREYGLNSFTYGILVSEIDDPRIKDIDYRRLVEALYIERYKSTNPKYGYNVKDDNVAHKFGKGKKSVKHKISTKILKAELIIAYSHEDDSSMMYIGTESCAKLLGISDRSIIISAIKKGKTVHNMTFFKADINKREEDAVKIISKKSVQVERPGSNATRKKSLNNYIKALRNVNEYCRRWDLGTLDIDKILNGV